MKILTKDDVQHFQDFIQNHESFVIIGHKEPDGDCIASSLALGSLLKKLGKKYKLYNAGPFKRTEIKRYEKSFRTTLSKRLITSAKTGLFIVDCSELSRIGDIQEQVSAMDTFIIDHHKTSVCNPDTSIIDSTAPAACCLIQQLYELTIGAPDKETAEILFFGLSTDTGYFRFLDTQSSEVFMAAARLVSCGANPRETYDIMTGGKTWETRKLLGIMLNKAELYYDGKLAVTVETIEDTRKYGINGRDSDMLYQMILAVDSIEAVVFLREDTDRKCTIGFRSKKDVDVSAIAASFGGGGHKNAAGACTEGTPDELLPKIINKFEKIF